MQRLREFADLARSIIKNSKGEVLLSAFVEDSRPPLRRRSLGAPTLQQKAVIFTESRRTQEYLV